MGGGVGWAGVFVFIVSYRNFPLHDRPVIIPSFSLLLIPRG